jgi:2-(3-amino-3-carboxypropyl)histidine synthase
MKCIFAEAQYTGRIQLGKEAEKLPQKIGLITTAQFTNQLSGIKKEIEKTGRIVLVSKGKQKCPGQVLGCECSAATALKKKVDAYLYIGTGEFHPITVAMQTGKTVYVFSPFGKLEKLDKNEIEKIENKKRGAYLKYLNAEHIGIITTTKPGQNKLKKAFELKEKLEKQGKKVYVFAGNTINFESLQDFNFVEAWVNTACPRIAEDFACINADEILI